MRSVRRAWALAFLMAVTVIPAGPGGAATGDPVLINEVLASTTSTDAEYLELYGDPGASLAGLSFIIVESDPGTSNGTIDRQYDFGPDAVLGDNGYLLLGNAVTESVYGVSVNVSLANNYFENSSSTYALVETASITGSTVDSSIVVVDAVASDDGDGSFFFDAPVIGPDGTYFPAGVSRVVDGVDTDTAADWFILNFNNDPTVNTPTAGTLENGEPIEALISQVQGSGDTSPLAGEVVVVEGIVVGDFEGGDGDDRDLDGFFVQEEDADQDSDPSTSEGIFVYNGRSGDAVSEGDLVRVVGTVGEYFENTQLADVTIDVLSSGNPLPSAAKVEFSLDSPPDLEAYEGMLVTFPQTLSILEYYNFDRFGEVVVGLPLDGQDRLHQPTAVFDPGSPESSALADYNDSARITIDDGRTGQNPDPAIHPGNGEVFDLDNRFRGGDTIEGVTGPIYYGFDLYRIMPTEYGTFEQANLRPEAPDEVGGDLKVAAFNALNYFLTIDERNDVCGPDLDQGCRGADTEDERQRQRAKLLAAIEGLDADVVGLIEVENTAGVEPLEDLVDGLNERLGRNTYRYVAAGENSVVGTDAIKVGLIYKPANVQPIGETAILDDPSFLDPNDLGDDKNRAAVAQTFVEKGTGERFTVVVNHLKSKGSGCGEGDDDPQAGSCNLTRTLAVEALLDWLDTTPTKVHDPDVLIIGDLNAYDEEDPIDALRAAGYTDLLKEHQGDLAYSYLFSAQLGYLDYGMASASLTSQVTGATAWHINADEPDILDYDTSFKRDAQDALYEPNAYRSSDHDPVLIGLDLASKPGRGLGRR